MTDLRRPVMEVFSDDFEADTRDGGRELLRFSIRRAFEAGATASNTVTLERAMEFEIVPRLVLARRRHDRAHAVNARPGRAPPLRLDSPDEVKSFADLVLGPSEDAAAARVESLLASGVPLETIYLTLLHPAARYLKYQWLEDERDFADVTLGLWRLQQLLRTFSAAFRNEQQKASGLRALLAPGPSEPQDLGYLMFSLVLLGEFFRRDGWDASVEPSPSLPALSDAIHNEWFDVVEFMVSGRKRLDELAATIKAIRRASLNQSVGVLVCGQLFVEHPELVLLVGGDMIAADPKDAAKDAQQLVRTIASRE